MRLILLASVMAQAADKKTLSQKEKKREWRRCCAPARRPSMNPPKEGGKRITKKRPLCT